MENQEIRIGLIGSQSMHAWAFAKACNEPDENGNKRFPNVRVAAVYGVDDTPEHIRVTMEKGSIPRAVTSLEELFELCNAFMILQRRGGEHMAFAEQIIKKGYPVFIDKPVCCTRGDAQKLKQLATDYDAVICGGSGFKHNQQIINLKKQLAETAFGRIQSASVTYSADINSPYDGIFFYLPHGVEVMLELFGYDPISVQTRVNAHNDFTVTVDYGRYTVNLILNESKVCNVTIQGDCKQNIPIDADDLFAECMGHFVEAICRHQVTQDTGRLTRHVEVILAIQESIDKNVEVKVEK
jgi:predicted dehydrogenase